MRTILDVDYDPRLGQFTDDPEHAPYICRRTGEFWVNQKIVAVFPGRNIPKDDWNVFVPIDEDGDVLKAFWQWQEMEQQHRRN